MAVCWITWETRFPDSFSYCRELRIESPLVFAHRSCFWWMHQEMCWFSIHSIHSRNHFLWQLEGFLGFGCIQKPPKPSPNFPATSQAGPDPKNGLKPFQTYQNIAKAYQSRSEAYQNFPDAYPKLPETNPKANTSLPNTSQTLAKTSQHLKKHQTAPKPAKTLSKPTNTDSHPTRFYSN